VFLDHKVAGAPKSGLQAFVVVASRQQLPPYAEWRKGRGGVAWRALPARRGVWEADEKGSYSVGAGLTVDRNEQREAPGRPPLKALCRALLGGEADAVEAVAFGVLAKEGKR